MPTGTSTRCSSNDGEIRGTCFHDEATRRENGMLFADIGGGFRSGRYAFNNRVRREIVLVDEARQVAMARGFIDHKGVLDEYLAHRRHQSQVGFSGTAKLGSSWRCSRSQDGCIAAVVATFYQAPYYQRSPWTEGPDR